MVHGRTVKAFIAGAIALGVTGAMAATPNVESVPGEYLVKFRDTHSLRTKNVFKSFGAEKVRKVSAKQGIYLIKKNILERPESAKAALAAQPGVEIVEPNYIYRVSRVPNDPKFNELWGLKNSAQKGGREGIDVGAEQAWDVETGSKDVIIAVIDTGVDYTHPDLKENIWTNEAELNGEPGVDDDHNGYVDDIHGYDFVNKDGDPMDDHGHGSHCSGTIGAKGDDGSGIVGVNWNVRIMGVKFLSGDGSGTLEDAIKAIDYATSMGAQIESNSWGGGGFSELLKQSIERARDKNVLFVAAAGNEANDNDGSPSYPATYDLENVLSVAAIDSNGQLAYFSNYGKTTVHVAAPGVDVFSSVPTKTNPDGYETWSGTSMATPHVSGIAGLIKAHFPESTYADIKQRIMSSARTLGSLRNKVVSSGVANAYYALTGEVPPPDLEDPFNWSAQDYSVATEHPYKGNTNQQYVVKVDGASKVSVYFEKFDTERGYDTVEFKDGQGKTIGKWTGTHDGEFSPAANGDTITLIFKSDSTVNGFGFEVTKAAYK